MFEDLIEDFIDLVDEFDEPDGIDDVSTVIFNGIRYTTEELAERLLL